MKRKHFIFALVAMLLSFSVTTSAEELLVNCDYNSSTEGYGVSKFSNYAGAYAYATANGKTSATIVIEKTNTLSGNTFDNNHKKYSSLAVVIKDGATMGNAASKWDMTYPVTVEPGGTLTCARPASASVSYIHIKNKLIVGAKGSTKKAVVDFLSDTYQDCDISIRHNGSIEVYNADFKVQDLDAQGKLTIEDSKVEVDGAFASATFFATTLTNTEMVVNGNQISGGLSDFAGGTSNQLGNVKLNNSTLTIKEGDTKVAATVTATNSTIAVNNLTVNSGKTLNLNEGSTLEAENITTAGTGSVKIDGVQAPVVDGAIVVPVADFAALKAAVEAGKNVQLTADITTSAAITTSGVTSVIDLNGKTLTIGAGDNKFNDESNITIKNGTVSITGVTVGGNAIFCLDEYEKALVTTVTLDNVNLVGDGYSSAYGIFYIGESSVLNVKGGEWNLKNDTHTSGGVFKADGSGAKLNIDGLNLTAHNVRRVVTYAATTIENSTMAISGDADGVDAQMEHGFNRSPLAITNSTITMKDMVGRGITAQNGAVTISENSKVEMTNCQEATIDVRGNQTVTIDNTSTVSVDKKPTVASGSAINGTVQLPPMGNDFTGYTRGDAIWGEVWGNAKESFVIKVLDANGNVMGTTSLNNVNGIIDGDVNVTWSLKLNAASNTDEYWTMAWTTAPTIDNMPAKVELWVDGVKVSGGNVVLNGPDEIAKIYAAVTDANGKILGYHTDIQEAIKAAAAVTSVARTATAGTVEVLSDVTVDKWVMFAEKMTISDGSLITLNINGVTIDGNGKTLTIKSIESAGNGGYLFYDAQNLTVKDLTINIADGLVGGIGLQSGTISNVTFNGGQYAVLPGKDGVTIDGCTFNDTKGYAIYYEDARPGIVVDGNTFNTAEGKYAITMRSNEQFTNNTINTGRVNLANSAASTVSGNDFGEERFKVYNGATATISDNEINNLVFNETTSPAASTFANNTLSAEAQAAIEALPVMAGDGTEANPYTIGNLAQLKAFRDDVNAGNNYQGKFVKLTADIDLNNEEWTPIAYNGKTFKGTFDGGSKTIKNLKITKTLTNSAENNGIGLFGRTDDPATIKNFTIENVDITGSLYVGAAVGYGYTGKLVENVTVKGNIAIDAWWYAGVIGGNGYMNTINNCHVIGNDGSYIKGNDGSYIGGIWGFRGEGANKITNCTVTNLDIQGVDRVGGISGIGHYGNSIEGCSVNNVKVTATDSDATTVGIIIGACQGTEEQPTKFADNTVQTVTVKIGDAVVENPGLYGTNINGGNAVTNYVAKIGNVYYESLAEAVSAAQSGATITLMSGEHELPEFAGKELTFKALDRENTSITDYVNKGSQGMMGSTVHFVNLTINGATENYYGLFHTAKVTYTNCIINGLRFLYATEGVSFEGCAFNANGVEHSFWTYGASNVTVKNSTFTYTDRAVNCYSENGANHEADITFEGCSFTYAGTNDAPEGAVEINSGSAKSFDIAFTGCTAPEKGAMWFNSKWDNKKGENTVVEVDDVIVWQVVKVAKIGDVEYTSLQAAFNAVQDGETITLVDNVTISAATAGYTDGTYTDGVRYTGDKSFTVDFNGKTVTDDGCVNDYLIYINNKGEKASEITFTNGTIVSANGCWSAVCVNSSAATQNVELNLNGMNITNSNDAVYSGNPVVRVRTLATVNVNDSTIITSNGASYGVAANTDGSTVNINEGATIVQQNSGTTGGNSVFAAVGGKGVINIKGGTITSDRYGVHTMTTGTPVINISGGTITAPVALKSSTNGGNGELATINVTGGTINGTLETYTDNGKIVVSGGTFSEAVAEEYCADGFVPAENADGTFGVEKAPVASINGTKYTSLAEAVAAAQAGDEIVLIANVKTTDGVVITDKNLTIDLNGKTYTVTEGASTNNRNFKINGTSVVTVKNGTMVAAGDYSSGAYGTIRTEGTANVTLTGLKLYNYRGNGLNIKACTGTTVTIENTEIYANYGGGIESAGGTIVVNDGVTVKQEGMYTAPYNSMAISVNGGGKVTVNGGTFSTECITAEEANNQGTSHGPWVAGVLNSGGTLIINGGTFSNDNFGENNLATAARGAILADTKAKVEINGGTFNVLKNVIDIQNNLGDANNNPSVVLSGGTYSADPRISAQYGSNLITLAEDYIAVENNGVWNVVKVVAKIGDVEYASLQDALNAAAAGTGNVTVSILADVDLTGVDWNPVTVSAPGYPVVTVEGNNKTITGLNDMLFAGTWAGGSGLIIKNLTIENSAIVNDKDDAKGTVGVGAFIGFPQASATITLENCHLKNSSVEGGHWTGGLIGYAAGYAGNDGPVFMDLTIKGCSVTGSTITGKGSVGGVIGHGSGNAWTNVVIEETTVSNNTITSTGSSNVKAGAVMGTIGAAGQPTTVNGVTKTGGMSVSATVAENTVKSNGTEITTIYGRQGTATGMLAVAGGSYDNYPIEEGVAYAAPAAGYKIEQNTDGTYGVVVDPEYGKVASVNGVYYETLAAAVDAVDDGGTITLIANETFTENNRYDNGGWWDGLGYSGDKSFTIDLANFTISQDGALNDYLMWFKNDGAKANTITLKNGTLDAGTTAYSALATSSSNAQKITVNLENIKVINNNNNGSTVKVRGGAELNVKAGTVITGKDSYLGIECIASTANIYDGAEIHMNGTSSYNGCLAGVGGNGTINVYGGEGKGVSGGFIAMTSGGTINIEGGEWTANTDGSYANSNKSVLVAQSDKQYNAGAGNSIVNVTGGTFKGGYNCYGNAAGDAQINIKGGNFNADPTSYVADGYVAVENNGVWNIVKAAAQIGSIAYTTIDAAIKAAQAGDVVTIAAGDYAQNLSINKAITVQGETNTVSTLSTAADSVSNNLVNFTGKLNITADGATVKNINVNNGNSSAGYINAMNVTVDGCQVVGGNGFRSCYTKGTVTFKNSVITGSTYGIHFDGSANGNIVIDNCIITGWTSFASTINNVAIKDSKFAEGNYNQLRFYQDVTIENTEFNENMTIDFGKDEVSAEFTNCTVSNGGKLTDVIYLADIVDMGIDVTVDGTPLAVSAKIGSTYYPTLAEAITAAKASDTITFVSDINESVTVNKNVTIDGANKKYTGTMTGNAGLNVTVQNVNFVNGGFAKATKTTTGSYTIKDCTFDGAGTYAYALSIKGANTVNVENCTVKNYQYSFFYVPSSTNSVSVKDVTVDNCPSYAVYFASGVNSATFENLTVKNSNNGFVINNTANRVFTMKNCKMENVTTAINHANGTNTITCTALGVNNLGKTVDELNLSQYAVIKGANVGTYYGTLQSMVEKAENGQTVKLLSDIAMTEADCVAGASHKVLVDVVDKDITLDMNGKTISVTHMDEFTNTAECIVSVIRVENGAGLTVTGNGTIDVNVKEGNPDIVYMFWKRGTTGHLTIENGTFHMNDAYDSMVYTNGNEIVFVKGGSWTLDSYGTRGNREPWIFNVQGAGDNHVVVTGGTFNADINRQHWSNEVVVPETHYTVANTDGTYTVKEGAVAYVNEGMLTGPYFVRKNIGYATLAEAMAEVDTDETVTMLKDVTLEETVTITADKKNITLDLAGKTISMNDASGKGAYAIKNNGSLTIKDAGENGKITFESTTPDNSFGYATSTIGNAGKLTVESGTIENTTIGGASYAIDGIWHTDTVSLTINGGTIIANKIAVRQVPFSATAKNVVTVNGGILQGATAGLQLHNTSNDAMLAEVNINGGEFFGEYGFYTSFSSASASSKAVINITDGTFHGYPYIYNGKNGSDATPMTVSVTGGYFDNMPYIYTKDANGNAVNIPAIAGGTYGYDVTDYCADDFRCVQNADGRYTVERCVFEFVDGEVTEFSNDKDIEDVTITYKRTFYSGAWNALYVPFEIPVSELSDNYEVAYVNDIQALDMNEDGETSLSDGEISIEYVKIKNGILRANHPYVIRPKNDTALNMELTLNNATLKSTSAENQVALEISTAYIKFTIGGTYYTAGRDVLGKPVNAGDTDNFCLAPHKSDKWMALSATAQLTPFRIYMTMENKDGFAYIKVADNAEIRARVIGEEDQVTGIFTPYVENEARIKEGIFDLMGRPVRTPEKGKIYIMNGKKVLF